MTSTPTPHECPHPAALWGLDQATDMAVRAYNRGGPVTNPWKGDHT